MFSLTFCSWPDKVWMTNHWLLALEILKLMNRIDSGQTRKSTTTVKPPSNATETMTTTVEPFSSSQVGQVHFLQFLAGFAGQ